LDAVRDAFGDRVHEVRAHRVATVHEQVHHHHAVAQVTRGDAAHAAAAPYQARHLSVGQRAQLTFMADDALACPGRVRHVVELHLRDHDRRVGLGLEAAAFADHACCIRRRRDH
jgi:hypothetical protein